MMGDDLLGFSEAADIGFKVAEMAERVQRMHALVPGSQASWAFEMDDVRFRVRVTVEDAAVAPQAKPQDDVGKAGAA